jgi:hypothetical protein
LDCAALPDPGVLFFGALFAGFAAAALFFFAASAILVLKPPLIFFSRFLLHLL